MNDIKDILINLGYSNITEDSKNYRMKPIYRDSSSSTVLSVRKSTGSFIDFSKQMSGTLRDLVKLSLLSNNLIVYLHGISPLAFVSYVFPLGALRVGVVNQISARNSY